MYYTQHVCCVMSIYLPKSTIVFIYQRAHVKSTHDTLIYRIIYIQSTAQLVLHLCCVLYVYDSIYESVTSALHLCTALFNTSEEHS